MDEQSSELPSPEFVEYISDLAEELQFELLNTNGRLRLSAPCPSPLSFYIEAYGGQLFVYFVCRADGFNWLNDRTDIHDLYSIYLACKLASGGLASCSLIDEEHPVVPEEMYARFVVLSQPNGGWYTDDHEGRAQLEALIRAFSEAETDLHCLGGPCGHQGAREDMSVSFDDEKLVAWKDDILVALDLDEAELDEIEDHRYPIYRKSPYWFHFYVPEVGFSAAVAEDLGLLLEYCSHPQEQRKRGTDALLFRRGILENALNYEELAEVFVAFKKVYGNEIDSATVIPLEDRVVVANGGRIVIQGLDAGALSFRRGVNRTIADQDDFLAWARPDRKFKWISPVPPGRFERLIYSLINAEPNVTMVRLVGATNDRDGGRDLIVDLAEPRYSDLNSLPDYDFEQPILKTYRIIVQCKTKRDPDKSVSKSDVTDIRDTVERYGADGYWLFVSSIVTSSLIDHLEALKNKLLFVKWWTRLEIEESLRKNPRLVEVFSDIVQPSD
ncbi:restriction endonuclease [Nocardia gipuzkoensis]